MPVIYDTTAINNRLQSVVNTIDAGPSNGVLRLLDNANNILSTLALAKPSGSPSGGVLTFNSLPLIDPSASRNGLAVSAIIEDSSGNVVISGLTVGTVASDIVLNSSAGNTFISVGATVALLSATITGH